jgi:protein TonB
MPSTIPAGVAPVHETPLAALSLDADTGPFIPGLIGVGTASSGVFIDAIRLPAPLPPPRTEPTAHTKPTPSAPATPIAVSSGVQAAKLIRQVKPAYSALAIGARIQGTVRLVAIIGRDGAIRNLQVASGHPLLTPAAVEAVKQWLYQPTLLNGEPVEVITQIDVNFTLSR